MSLSSIALTVAIVLSLLYTMLAVIAFTHVSKEKTIPLMPGLLALTFWWPFYDIYEEPAHGLRLYGKIILPIVIAAYVLWGVQIA